MALEFSDVSLQRQREANAPACTHFDDFPDRPPIAIGSFERGLDQEGPHQDLLGQGLEGASQGGHPFPEAVDIEVEVENGPNPRGADRSFGLALAADRDVIGAE